MADNEFINPNEKPALLAYTNAEFLEQTRAVLNELGYKCHAVFTHDEFNTAFGQMEYKLVMLEETFNSAVPEENHSLARLQKMPMSSRRHATVILIGSAFQTLSSMQAFQQSVHAVVNYTEYSSLPAIIPKVVSDNDAFLHAYREGMDRIAQGKTTV